ncbi:MAG TPA: PLP-dependent transferase [Candidatus Fraserbacteria bacterium]|nr:PLP-dependent transferase [Candidatus Fraserbacteria bacterium]
MKNFYTQAVHAGEQPDPSSGAADLPIYQSSTFTHRDTEESAAVVQALQAGERKGYLYTRWGNPTVQALEEKLAALEGGQAALAFSSGMAAIATVLLSLVKSGDKIVAARQLYSGTSHLLTERLPALGVETTFVASDRIENFAQAIRPTTKLIYIETPSNPLLEITDIQAIARLAQEHQLVSIIDNTFATPFNQRPLELGIDLVVYSTTKYLCGHGDAMGGAVIGRQEFIDRVLTGFHRDLGGVLSPFNAWLTARGMRTLPLRLERHNANALTLAQFLQQHSGVRQVYYPGLPSHPGHELARRQMPGGFGGMLSFEVQGGLEAGKRALNRVQLCTRAVSLGDVKTLITHPASTTHYIVPPEARRAAGISDGLIRLSVGIEDVQDLMDDLAQALR